MVHLGLWKGSLNPNYLSGLPAALRNHGPFAACESLFVSTQNKDYTILGYIGAPYLWKPENAFQIARTSLKKATNASNFKPLCDIVQLS